MDSIQDHGPPFVIICLVPLAETFPQVFFDMMTLPCLKTTDQLLHDVSQFELSNVSSWLESAYAFFARLSQ